MKGVVQGSGSMEALFVEKEFALPAGVEGGAGRGQGVAAGARGLGPMGSLMEAQAMGVAEMLELHMSVLSS